MLQKDGHDVVACTDGEEAWLQYKLFKPPVIISDWIMPVMDGLELCTKIRSRKSKEYTYLILLTELNSDESHRLAIDKGVDDFLTKPMNIHSLRMRLHVAQRIIGFHEELETLRTLIPICMYCHKVRDDSDFWIQIETYFHEKQGADFSHGICPECYEKYVSKKSPEESLRPEHPHPTNESTI